MKSLTIIFVILAVGIIAGATFYLDRPKASPFSQAIATLVSPQTSSMQKQAAWKQLLDSGKLDQAIEALKQGAVNHPTSAGYPAALGEAELQKANAIFQSGGNIHEMGILGMQADQSFDAALKIDPANWEAQFSKAAAMSYWPAELNKGGEVVQRFSSLIDQQETMTPQPEFAQTYVLLGNEYQKLGQPDKAQATWQLGLTKFPGNSTLQNKIAHP
jgi:tetratricopeptide (TPR) repeat protein